MNQTAKVANSSIASESASSVWKYVLVTGFLMNFNLVIWMVIWINMFLIMFIIYNY